MEAEIRAQLALNQEAMQSWDEKVSSLINRFYIQASLVILHSQKRASCSKSAISKPISGCVRIACYGLMITSLLQVVIRLAASCELHAGLMQVVS